MELQNLSDCIMIINTVIDKLINLNQLSIMKGIIIIMWKDSTRENVTLSFQLSLFWFHFSLFVVVIITGSTQGKIQQMIDWSIVYIQWNIGLTEVIPIHVV